jgi:hypothetical protein
MSLASVKAALDQLAAAIAALEADGPVDPVVAEDAPFGRSLDGSPKFAPAYDACRTMLRAAERAQVFAITALLGGGIKQGAAHLYQDFKPNLRLIEDSIVALGKGPWGQEWLDDLENRATVSQDYVRKFGFKTVTRKPDGTLVEVD